MSPPPPRTTRGTAQCRPWWSHRWIDKWNLSLLSFKAENSSSETDRGRPTHAQKSHYDPKVEMFLFFENEVKVMRTKSIIKFLFLLLSALIHKNYSRLEFLTLRLYTKVKYFILHCCLHYEWFFYHCSLKYYEIWVLPNLPNITQRNILLASSSGFVFNSKVTAHKLIKLVLPYLLNEISRVRWD